MLIWKTSIVLDLLGVWDFAVLADCYFPDSGTSFPTSGGERMQTGSAICIDLCKKSRTKTCQCSSVFTQQSTTNVSESVPSSFTGSQLSSDCKVGSCNYGTECDILTTSSDIFKRSHNPLVVGSSPTGPSIYLCWSAPIKLWVWTAVTSENPTLRDYYGCIWDLATI